MRPIAFVLGCLTLTGTAGAAEWERVAVTIRPGGLSNRLPETITIRDDGRCFYAVPERTARGEDRAWPPANVVHNLPPEQVRRLERLIRDTDWLAKENPTGPPGAHAPVYEFAITRAGGTVSRVFPGGSGANRPLLDFFQAIAEQEYLHYRLTWGLPATLEREAVRELDQFAQAELGGTFDKPRLPLDYGRFAPWAVDIVRRPFDRPTHEVVAAVRLVGVLKLSGEWDAVAKLGYDREREVREVVALAAARLAGGRAIPALRRLVDNTTAGPWELIRLGPPAVPAVAEDIGSGRERGWLAGEQLVRAYIEHWADVPKPLDPRVPEAVRAAIRSADGNALYRTTYHRELLRLAGVAGP